MTSFFTTRRDTGGTGMGLSIVQVVMASHGGSTQLVPSNAGVTFELRFRRPEGLPSDALDNDRRRHAAGGAHRHQAALEIAPLKLIQHGANQD